MPTDSFPQEILDEIVDKIAEVFFWNERRISVLLQVSSKFRNRARHHIFRKIHIGGDWTRGKLRRRLKLLDDIILASDPKLTPIATLVRSFSLAATEHTANDVFIATPQTLLRIMDALSGKGSNLITFILKCQFVVNHHCVFNAPLLAALSKIVHAPQLVNVCLFNISLGTWIHGSNIERLYARFGFRTDYDWITCLDKEAGDDGGEGCLWNWDRTAQKDPIYLELCGLPHLTTVIISTSLMKRSMFLDKEGNYLRMPILDYVKVCIDTWGGFESVPSFLKESHASLKSLQLDFTHGHPSDETEYRNILSIATFTRLKKFGLKDLSLQSRGSEPIYSTFPQFLKTVIGLLADDSSTPCPLQEVYIDMGWSDSTHRSSSLDSYNRALWGAFDNALANLVHIRPNDPPTIKLVVRLGININTAIRYSTVMKATEALGSEINLPKTHLTDRLHCSFPSRNSTTDELESDPDGEMTEMLTGMEWGYDDVNRSWYR